MDQDLTSRPTFLDPPAVVLVVDDAEENRYVAARWLERAGYRVAEAATAAEALRLAKGEIELVVLDVHLPNLHGLEVARKLKEDPLTAHLPVLYLSAGSGSAGGRATRLEGRADVYLTHPVVPEDLVASVDTLLKLSRTERTLRERNLELQAARADALRVTETAERVLALSIALSTAGTPREVADAVIRHATAMFAAAGAVIVRREEGTENLEILSVRDMPDDVRSTWRRFPSDARVPLADVVRTGAPIFLESRDDWAARYPEGVGLLVETGHHANAIAPLVVDGRVLGSLGVAFTAPHVFTSEDRALLQSTAQHAALALERARLLESEHASREVAEAASLAKSEFLAVMSHELRTPLNAIGGYVELIEMGLQGPVTAAQKTSLARIQRSQRHLLGLINGVLNYARVEGGHVHYDLTDVKVDEILATSEALIAPQARARNVSLRFDACSADLRARGDSEKVQQIVLNLLSNAVKFTEPGGAVELICDTEAGDSSSVLIRVIDTGPGIEPAQAERIFQPFVQLDARLTRTREGTGLGLAISRDLAHGMGGDLTVESRVGVGSTFTLVLPRAPG